MAAAAAAAGAGGAGGGGASAALGDGGAIDYSVHEAWNEATNVYLLVVLASLALLVYARRNKRRIMRIFTLPPAAETPPEPNFYDSMKKIRLRQQLEMYSIVAARISMLKVRMEAGKSPKTVIFQWSNSEKHNLASHLPYMYA
ncbi:small integral membrane protein 19 isoform 1-T1 [Passerculus sandwichensis]